MLTDAERIARLERQIDALRRAVGLLTVSGAATVEWLDKTFDGIDAESGDK